MRILFLLLILIQAHTVYAQVDLDKLRFITEEYPPYNFVENAKLSGIAVDLLERALASEGKRLDRDSIELLPWARGYETALNTPNTVLFSTTRTETRESLFQWAGPISADRVVLMARKSSGIKINSVDELNQSSLNIAVIHEDIGAQRLQELGVNPARIHTAMNNTGALTMLNANRVDLWAYGEDVAFWLMDKGGYDREEFEPVFTLSEAYLYFALNVDSDPELVHRFQNAIMAAKEDFPKLRLLTEDYPPFNYLNQSGEVVGSATELLKTAFGMIGIEAEFQLLPWARALTETQMIENTCVYSTTRTQEREEQFVWIGPLLNNQWGAFTLAASDVQAKHLDEISHLRMGSSREDAIAQYVQNLGYDLVLASSDPENVDRLKAGLIDVWLTSIDAAEHLASGQNIALDKLFIFNDTQLYLACNKAMNQNLQRLLQVTLDSVLNMQNVR